MSNTQLRVISGLILLTFLILNLYLGQFVSKLSVGLIGLFLIWEINSNFLFKKFTSLSSMCSYILFIFLYFSFFSVERNIYILCFGVFLSLILLVYLSSSLIPLKKILMVPFWGCVIPTLYFSFVLIIFAQLISSDNWLVLIALLFCAASVTDVFAWVFGKSLGRHKLWPAISPKKTVEGLVGGVVSSSLFSFYVWKLYFDQNGSVLLISVFAMFSFLSQTGDLVQSKIKREFGIKDSSNLIPGHGGFYDRFDSYLFILPFFMLAIELLKR